MKSYKKLSGNDVSELLGLMNEIDHNIKNVYLHVSDNLPIGFINMVEKIRTDLVMELDRRELAAYENEYQ